MRSLTALAVVLAAAVSIPPALAQGTAPSTSDPSAGAQQEMPGAAGSGAGQDGGTTIPGTGGTTMPGTGAPSAQDSTMPEAPSMGTDTAQDAVPGADMPAVMTQQESDHVLAEDYIGAKVVAQAEEGLEEVGTVSDLVLGPDDKIVGVVVDVGGFLGVAAKPVGLSWTALEEQRSEGELLLRTSLTRQDLEDAPAYQTQEESQVESDQQMMDTTTPPAQ